MINGLDIYYSKKVSGSGLKPISQKANGLKPISNKQKASGLKGGSCKKVWIRIKNFTINLIFINNI